MKNFPSNLKKTGKQLSTYNISNAIFESKSESEQGTSTLERYPTHCESFVRTFVFQIWATLLAAAIAREWLY